MSLPQYFSDMSHGLVSAFLSQSLLAPVCCCFCVPSLSGYPIHISCSLFQMSDICEAYALYHSICIFIFTCALVWGVFLSLQLCFAFFIISNSLLPLVVSSITFCTLCSFTPFAQPNTRSLVTSLCFLIVVYSFIISINIFS